MFPKLASVTQALITLITRNGAGPLKFVESSRAGMTKASVPNRCRSDTRDEDLLRCGDQSRWNGVEVVRAIVANDLTSGLEVLNRETERVKFNGDNIITSELTNI
jgi:hypothetical protein